MRAFFGIPLKLAQPPPAINPEAARAPRSFG